jgi:hypothetical protein
MEKKEDLILLILSKAIFVLDELADFVNSVKENRLV